MGRKKKMEGGFAYRNMGIILNSNSAVKIGSVFRFGSGKSENAGFVYENSGQLYKCF